MKLSDALHAQAQDYATEAKRRLRRAIRLLDQGKPEESLTVLGEARNLYGTIVVAQQRAKESAEREGQR